MKIWELALRGGPSESVFTEAGVRGILPLILSDLDSHVNGDPERFVRILLESFPYEMFPISLTVYAWEEQDQDEGRVRLFRFYPEWVQGSLDLDSPTLNRLEREAKKIVLPSVSERGVMEGKVVRQYGSLRVTYSIAHGEPSQNQLHAILKAFDESGKSEASMLLEVSRSIRVEGNEDPGNVEEEIVEFFVERMGVT